MLISAKKIARIWGLRPNGVLHVGAHHAEEASQYTQAKWGHIYWIEANPLLSTIIRGTLNPENNTVIECAAWDVDDLSMTFHETSDSQSSSLLKLKKHKIHYPQIHQFQEYQVQARRMDSIFISPVPFTFANIDVQGAELQVMKGLGELTESITAIYTEVNREELYEGCADIKDIDEYLKILGYERVATRWILGKGWGDALYINKKRFRIKTISKILNFLDEIPFYTKQQISRVLRKLHLTNLIRKILG
jgi:FkbM family methyltransferase